MTKGLWRDPGAEALRVLFRRTSDSSELELFEALEAIEAVRIQIGTGGLIEDPEFCMVHTRESLVTEDDPRLVFNEAIFIGGSVVPGDDVLVAVQAAPAVKEPVVRVFDWNSGLPHRWVTTGTLAELMRELAAAKCG